jgi:hypothetical protein
LSTLDGEMHVYVHLARHGALSFGASKEILNHDIT